MMTSMPTTPYLLDPVLCCGSFSASSKLAHVRSQPPVTDGRRLIELASLENETTHELKSRKRYTGNPVYYLSNIDFSTTLSRRRNTQSKLPVNKRFVRINMNKRSCTELRAMSFAMASRDIPSPGQKIRSQNGLCDGT
jgi:hypothetical protein